MFVFAFVFGFGRCCRRARRCRPFPPLIALPPFVSLLSLPLFTPQLSPDGQNHPRRRGAAHPAVLLRAPAAAFSAARAAPVLLRLLLVVAAAAAVARGGQRRGGGRGRPGPRLRELGRRRAALPRGEHPGRGRGDGSAIAVGPPSVARDAPGEEGARSSSPSSSDGPPAPSSSAPAVPALEHAHGPRGGRLPGGRR